jgi:hypothetical protein
MGFPPKKYRFDEVPSYMGGCTTIHGGYVYESLPSHPLANRWGFVAQHRLIGEVLLGRPLVQHTDPKIRECVHHKDENRLNNSPDNLQVMTFSEHRRHHTRKRNIEEFDPRRPSREAVAAALSSTATIKLAAESLGLCHHTLRKHFPDLLEPYKRRKPTNPLAPSEWQLYAIRIGALDPAIGEREIAAQVGISGRTVRKICDTFGLPWIKKIRSDRKIPAPPSREWLAICASQTAPAIPPTGE